jgi:hypothetical protein
MPWLPGSLAVAGGGATEEDLPPPALAFDEHELARIAALVSPRGRQAAEAAMVADPSTRLAQAMEQLAEVLADRRRHELQDGTVEMRRILALAAAIARVMPRTAHDATALTTRCAELLAGVTEPARLVLPAADAQELRPLLPELADRAGLVGGLELEDDPLLPPGAVRLLWPGGWLEQDPAATAARVAALLAAHGGPEPSASTIGADDAHDPY